MGGVLWYHSIEELSWIEWITIRFIIILSQIINKKYKIPNKEIEEPIVETMFQVVYVSG